MKWLVTLLFVIVTSAIVAQECNITDNGDLSFNKLYSYQFKVNYKPSNKDTTIAIAGETHFAKDTSNLILGVAAYIRCNLNDYLYKNESSTVWNSRSRVFYEFDGPRQSFGSGGLSLVTFAPLMDKRVAPVDSTHRHYIRRTDSFIEFGYENVSIIDTARKKIFFDDNCMPYKMESYSVIRNMKEISSMEIYAFDSTSLRKGFFDSIRKLYAGYEKFEVNGNAGDTINKDAIGTDRSHQKVLKIPKDSFKSTIVLDGNKYSSGQEYMDTVEHLRVTDLVGNQRKLKTAASSGKSIVKFWYIGCAPCILADKYMEDSLQIDEAVNVIHVNPYDSREEIREFYEKDNIDPTHYYTTEFVYDKKLVKSYPTFFFYQDGEMVKFLKGWGEHLKWYMAQFMEE